MSNWTPTAREALERYLQNNRAGLTGGVGDADEVISDLRRHIEEEAAALKLPIVTEQDVNHIISRVGPLPQQNTSTATLPPPPASSTPQTPKRKSAWSKVGSAALLLFGVILPFITLGAEFVMHMCAELFFDPIPTWFHVLLVALVPVANLAAWRNHDVRSPVTLKRIWLANGAALGIGVCYSLLFLPMSPIAVIGIVFFGFGFLPLAPLLGLIATLYLRLRLKVAFKERDLPQPRGWGVAALLAILVLAVMALPGPVTRHWIEQASSDDPEASLQAIKRLRTFGSERTILEEAYGRQRRELGWNFSTVDAEKARAIYYRVTGQPFNAVPPPINGRIGNRGVWNEFEWDEGLGGETVAGQVKGLSISASRLDGICRPEEGWAYVEWIFEFQNDHQFNQREARAQIQLPPGGVVSRLTLWVNDEEREAAFAGRGEVREAYKKVAVEQRRDPVLVTTSGPDRVLMQCFPIPPKGGRMKVRLGVTIPLVPEEKQRLALRLPYITERNFRLTGSFQHHLWLETSPRQSGGAPQGIRKQLTDAELSSPEGVLWFNTTAALETVRVVDRKGTTASVIEQTVKAVKTEVPERIAIVLDGSKSMRKPMAEVARSLDGLPGNAQVSIWLAQDGVQHVYDSSVRGARSASSAVEELRGLGGQDSLPALVQAWDWAAAKPNSIVLWIHGTQPNLLSSVEPLKQRLDWRSGGDSPRILDIAVEAGPNRIAEQVSTSAAMSAVTRFGSLKDDLGRLFEFWSGRKTAQQFVRSIATNDPAIGDTGGSSHIARLWAYDEIKRLIAARNMNDAIKLAALYQLVTPVSGAVVLETKQQYADAGLTPVDAATVPTVPEPSTWALMIIGMLILLYCGRRRCFGGSREQGSPQRC